MDVVNPRQSQDRVEPRTNLLLAATMTGAGAVYRCRIRNLSKTGALLEIPENMPLGLTVLIGRGDLSASGEIVWSANGRCGVRFASDLQIGKWLPDGTPSSRSPNAGSASSSPSPVTKPQAAPSALIDGRISEELAIVARTIEMVNDVLVKDPVLRMRHAMPLQQLSICQQSLEGLAQVIATSDRQAAIKVYVEGPTKQRLLRS